MKTESSSPFGARAPARGDVIEDYEILEKIGGNMGMVFKARHRLLDKIVALKLLPVGSLADSARLARFRREMRVLGQLEHPNLVTAADARSLDCWLLVAMEWIEGVDLQELVRNKGSLPLAVACEAVRQAALGLDFAHQHGLIHRDVKPSNLMLTRSGTIKVIDMGLALISEGTSAQLTQEGHVLGTLAYCAPEQVRDASKVDFRADLYSLGCTLYHLLAGKVPYCDRKTVAEVLEAHLSEPFPKLAEARPDAPPRLTTILERMTAKDPGSRFASASEVVQALEPFARGADLKCFVRSSTPAARPYTGTPTTPLAPHNGAHATPQPEQSRKRPVMTALLVLLLTSLSFGFGYIVKPTPQPTPQPTALVPNPFFYFMDTTATNGVYDPENRGNGGSNANELGNILAQDWQGYDFRAEPISEGWGRENPRVNAICEAQPTSILIHRSAFFHAYNTIFKFDPTHTNKLWQEFYDLLDEHLIFFLATVAIKSPHTKFLVYSRGTGEDWLNITNRIDWVKRAERRCPELKGRLFTMLVPKLTEVAPKVFEARLRDPKLGAVFRHVVKVVLNSPPPDMTDVEANEVTDVAPPKEPKR